MTFDSGSVGLNRVLNGGYPGEAISLILGKTGTGRSTFALSAAVAAVKAGRQVRYFDAEGSISPDRLYRAGLPSHAGAFAVFNPTSLDQCLDAAYRSFDHDTANLVVLDSLNLWATSGESIASSARLLTSWLPRFRQVLRGQSTGIIVTWQQRGSWRDEGPAALNHQAYAILQLTPADGQIRAEVRKLRDSNPGGVCLLRTDGGQLRDVEVHPPIDRTKIPTRFNRKDPI